VEKLVNVFYTFKFTQSCCNEVPRKTKNMDPGTREESGGDVDNKSAVAVRSSNPAKRGGRPEDPLACP
jgi:hypothetical protein